MLLFITVINGIIFVLCGLDVYCKRIKFLSDDYSMVISDYSGVSLVRKNLRKRSLTIKEELAKLSTSPKGFNVSYSSNFDTSESFSYEMDITKFSGLMRFADEKEASEIAKRHNISRFLANISSEEVPSLSIIKELKPYTRERGSISRVVKRDPALYPFKRKNKFRHYLQWFPTFHETNFTSSEMRYFTDFYNENGTIDWGSFRKRSKYTSYDDWEDRWPGEVKKSSSTISSEDPNYYPKYEKKNYYRSISSYTSSETVVQPMEKRFYKNIILYYKDISAAVLAVQLCMENLGVKVRQLNVKVFTTDPEHSVLYTQFRKENPAETLPTLFDKEKFIIDSQAIMVYLVENYATRQYKKFYPKNDASVRLLIDSRLQFLNNFLLPAGMVFHDKVRNNGVKSMTRDDIDMMKSRMCKLNDILQRTRFIADVFFTIADFAYIALLATWKSIPLMPDFNGYLNIKKWIHNCETHMTGFELIIKPLLLVEAPTN